MSSDLSPIEAATEAATAPNLSLVARLENWITTGILAIMVILSAVNALSRLLTEQEIPAAGPYIQHLNLILTFFGAVIAARSGRHLTFSTGHSLSQSRYGWWIERMVGLVGGTLCFILAWASYQMALSEKDAPSELPGGIPVWEFIMIMPIGFLWMGLRFMFRDVKARWGVLTVLLSAAAAYGIGTIPPESREWMMWPGIGFLLFTGLVGTPIFLLMSGIGLLLFFIADVTVSAVPTETYHIVASPTLPVVPLFTFAGYLLARGGASQRLVRMFNAWFGWMPGGVAIVTALVCAFFTTFTGASGVTILGMGGFLLPLLVNGGYPKDFSISLLTTSGSLGMLFPPSLPVILYGVMAGIAIDKLFLGGLLPGLFLLSVVSVYGIIQGIRYKVPRSSFDLSEALKSLWIARYELLLPVLLFLGLFGIPGVMAGFLNLGEAAALLAFYILFVECVLTRELKPRDVPAVLLECSTVIGTLLIIFGAALGLTNYLVDAEIPMTLAAWVKVHIHERWLFLLVLNGVLLVVGSMMEGFSAIVILVPLIAPIGAAFGIHPVHLGILFLANLEVGFLLPPVGLNLFLSSIRFQRPLASLYRPILPFLLLMALSSLVISYVPALTLALVPEDAPVPGQELPPLTPAP